MIFADFFHRPLTRASTAVSAPAAATNSKYSAIAAAIDAEKIDFSTFCEKLPDYLQAQVAKLQGDDSRKKFLGDLVSGVQATLTALVANTGGEFGTRGESYMGIILVLSCSIIIGLHSVLETLIRVLIRVSGSLYVVVGIVMIAAGLFELRANASLFYLPVEKNKLVTSGIFRMVRHPVYGGLLLLCIGLSITSQRWDKMVLSVVLGVVLVSSSAHYCPFLARGGYEINTSCCICYFGFD
jgi:protein-S-isoprenylcysteine O-methyltransferase Ste14